MINVKIFQMITSEMIPLLNVYIIIISNMFLLKVYILQQSFQTHCTIYFNIYLFIAIIVLLMLCADTCTLSVRIFSRNIVGWKCLSISGLFVVWHLDQCNRKYAPPKKKKFPRTPASPSTSGAFIWSYRSSSYTVKER